MVNPVPGYKVSVAYKKTGPYWKACGWHTGVDIAAPKGTTVVAARPGTVKHTKYGSAFGSRQFAVVCSDGTEDFYAHCSSRPAAGTKVKAGQAVAKVSDWGNTSGPHLHFERHAKAGTWSCSNMRNPKWSIEWEEPMGVKYHYGGKPSGTLVVKKRYVILDRSRWFPIRSGLEHAMIYVNVSNAKFEAGKQIGLLRVRAIRENTNDATSYHDYPIIAGASNQLITHPYFESGDGGPTHYELKCHSGLTEVTLGTRYRKGAVIY